MDAITPLTARQKWESLFWLLLGLGFALTWFVMFVFEPRGGKGEFSPHGNENARLVAIIILVLVTGMAFGAALGTMRRQQLVHAVIGIFAWPALLIAGSSIYTAFLESLWLGVLLLSFGGAALKAILVVDRVMFRDG